MIFIFLSLLLSEHLVSRVPLERVIIQIEDGQYLFGSARDLLIDGKKIYLVENREHRIHELSLGKGAITYTEQMTGKGEGPGEIWLPSRMIRLPATGYAVLDNRGISVFDENGRFSNRFRVFTPNIAMTAIGDEIFFLTARFADGSDTIDVYAADGTRKRSFFPEFLTVASTAGDPRSIVSNKAYMFDGPLHTDGTHLYYFSNTTGRFVKMSPSGEILIERDAGGDFGRKGRLVLEKNKEYLADPRLMDQPEGHIEYYLSWDSYFANGRLYLVRWGEPESEWFDGQKEILVYDAGTLQLIEILTFTAEIEERFHALAVTDDGTERHFYAVMETKQHLDVQIVELRP